MTTTNMFLNFGGKWDSTPINNCHVANTLLKSKCKPYPDIVIGVAGHVVLICMLQAL